MEEPRVTQEEEEVVIIEENSGGASHAVGQKAPNRYGIYDMSGNVKEWCFDARMQPRYRRLPRRKLETDPICYDPKSYFRVLRGGGYRTPAEVGLLASRFFSPFVEQEQGVGFRIARWDMKPPAFHCSVAI